MRYYTKKRTFRAPTTKRKKTKGLLCFNRCHKKIYTHSDRTQHVCHDSVNYIWNILTNNKESYKQVYSIDDFKHTLFNTNRDMVYLVDIDFNDIDRELRYKPITIFNLHTLLIERKANKYKIYQSYVLKYTIHEWLNGILNKKSHCRSNYSFIEKYNNVLKHKNITKQIRTDLTKNKDMYIELNNNNKSLNKYYYRCVNEFGGNNCISKSTMSRFLDLLQNFINAFNSYDVKKGNSYARRLFGWDILTDNIDTEEQTYVSDVPHNMRLNVQSRSYHCNKLI